MNRVINGPDPEHMTAAEVAEWLGVSLSTLKILIRDGEFPPPAVFGRATNRWPWLDVVSYSHLRARMAGVAARRPP